MKKLSLLFIVVFLYADPVLQAQAYKVKTIFELLKVPDTRKPLNTAATPEKKEELFLEESKSVIDEAFTVHGEVEKGAEIAKLAEWLRKNPAGKRPAEPEILMNLTIKGPFYDSKLEYTGKGSFRVVTEFGQVQELKDLFYVRTGQSGVGFNVFDNEKNSRYYDATGRLLFDRKFGYVEKDYNYCYRFYEGKKAGMADSSGKILLPAEYDEVSSFVFNKKLWFSVKKGVKCYYLELGTAKPVMENEEDRAPYAPNITADRYWVIRGRVYDMIKKEELFATINKEIHLLSDTWPLFYIKIKNNNLGEDDDDNSEEVYFDAAGNLLLGEPISEHNGLSDTTSIMKIFNKDTLIRGRKYTLYKSGIIHDKGKWLTKPEYDYLSELGRTNTLVFYSGSLGSTKPGLMDAAGKALIPQGRFWHIDEGGRDGHYVCYSDSASLLWDIKTKTFTGLSKNYFAFRSFDDMEKMGLMAGIAPPNKYYLLDTSYNIVDTTAWADIYLPSYKKDNLIALFPFVDGERDFYGEKTFMNGKREKLSFTWNGVLYNTFTEADSLAPGSYFYQRADKKNIVQVKPGQYFFTDCERIVYDPFFNWYIGRKPRGGTGILDENGKELLPFVFDRIEKYSHHYAAAQLEFDRNAQQLDKNGKLLFDGKYNNVIPVTDGFFIVQKDGKKGLVNRSGKEIIPLKYPFIATGFGNIWYGNDENAEQFIRIGSLQKGE